MVSREISLHGAPEESASKSSPWPAGPSLHLPRTCLHHVLVSWVLRIFGWVITNVPTDWKRMVSPGFPLHPRAKWPRLS